MQDAEGGWVGWNICKPQHPNVSPHLQGKEQDWPRVEAQLSKPRKAPQASAPTVTPQVDSTAPQLTKELPSAQLSQPQATSGAATAAPRVASCDAAAVTASHQLTRQQHTQPRIAKPVVTLKPVYQLMQRWRRLMAETQLWILPSPYCPGASTLTHQDCSIEVQVFAARAPVLTMLLPSKPSSWRPHVQESRLFSEVFEP